MPESSEKRKRRRRRKSRARSNSKAKARHEWVAKFWTDRIESGKEVRKEYDAAAEEVESYLKSNHQHLFEDGATRNHFMKFEGSAIVSVPKVAQMFSALGPRLYAAKPIRTVTPESDDGVMVGLARVLGAYLNSTARETKFVKEYRKAINDSMIRGRGFLRQTYDRVKDLITSRYIASTDVVFDPDYDTIEDAMWIAFRQREPRWLIEREIKDKDRWRIKELKSPKAEDSEQEKNTGTAEQIEVWTVLSKMGPGFRAEKKENKQVQQWMAQGDEDFVQIQIVQGHQYPLAETDWDVPFYLDKEWPLSYTDFVEAMDEPWPESIFGQVLPLQKTIDLLTSSGVNNIKNRDRFILMGHSSLEKNVKQRLKCGTSAEFIGLEVPPGQRLQDILHVPDFGNGSERNAAEREFLIGEMEGATGVTTALTGAQDDSARERSAAASRIKFGATQTRTADMQHRSEELHTDAARKEAISAKLLLSEDDITPYVDTSKIGMYYVSLRLPGGAEIPVRDPRPEKQRIRAQKNPQGDQGPITLELISPSASNYFMDVEQAYQAAMMLVEDIQMSEDEKVIEIASLINLEAVDPEDGLPLAVEISPVTASRVWQDTAGMTAEEVMREMNYEIASGSGIKVNKEAEVENAQEMTQTVLPQALGRGDIPAANKVLDMRDEALEVPQDQRVRFSQLELPQTPAGPGEGKGSKDAG